MNNLEILTGAFNYIEKHLQTDIRTTDVAAACYCSKSSLEKIFRYLNNMSLHDYVIRRKMMLAAKIITKEPSISLLDVALACGYSSNESFSRAFKRVWNCNPSEFKSKENFYELFPRLHPPITEGGTFMRKNVDISELYDLFVERRDCYFVCCDIKSLIPINNISYKAGDLAIIESMNRINAEADDDDIVFRIGGDEFAMLTNSRDINYAQNIAKNILSKNGQTFNYDNQDIPLNLYANVVKYEGSNYKYNDLYTVLHSSINEIKS